METDFQKLQIGYIKVHYVIETKFFVNRDWMDLLAFKPNVLIKHCFEIYNESLYKLRTGNLNDNIGDNYNHGATNDGDEKEMDVVDIDSYENTKINGKIVQNGMNGVNGMKNETTGTNDDETGVSLDQLIQDNVALNSIQFTDCSDLKQYFEKCTCIQDEISVEPAMIFMQQVSKFIIGEEKNRKYRWKAMKRAIRKKKKKKKKMKNKDSNCNCNSNINDNCNTNNNNKNKNGDHDNCNENSISFNVKNDRIWKYYPTKYFDFKPNTSYHMLETQVRFGEIDLKDARLYYPFHVGIALSNVCHIFTCVIYLSNT